MRQSTFHVAIIMDGNGRWASERGADRTAGHRAGAESVRRVVEAAPAVGIDMLTLYAFSSDNWNRPADEVSTLMLLLRNFLRAETPRCIREGVRVSVIGRRDRLSPSVLREIERTESLTKDCSRLFLRIAIDYSSRDVLLRAAAALDKASTQEEFAHALARAMNAPTADDVDLLIRPGREQRISDFLLWECAYAELYFTSVMWPDFSGDDLREAVEHFRGRERRFGRVKALAR